MFKSLRLIPSLSVALTTLFAETALSLPPPPDDQSVEATQEVPQSGAEVPICYMQTAEGKVLDLTSLCKEQPGSNLSGVSPAPRPYNASAIKKFDDELYGEGN